MAECPDICAVVMKLTLLYLRCKHVKVKVGKLLSNLGTFACKHDC